MFTEYIRMLLLRGYVPVAEEVATAEAQEFEGQFYMPRWGPKTFEKVSEEFGGAELEPQEAVSMPMPYEPLQFSNMRHTMRCAVLPGKHAVLAATGVFHPSWTAQAAGWRLVQAKTKLQKFVLNTFFNLHQSL